LDKRLTPPDALKIYALKTAPAFEAALYCGARLAGPVESSARPMRSFARNLGVAFQILNDLKDWRLDDDNKLSSGGDLLGGRPTVLWALALQGLAAPEQAELIGLIGETSEPVAQRIRRARELYQQAQVFDQAFQLVYQHRRRAEAAVRDLHPEPLQDLLHYLVEAVLAGSTEPLAEPWDARDLSLEAERVPSTG
jgi:geranylgeranyl pyrophosphate synthase